MTKRPEKIIATSGGINQIDIQKLLPQQKASNFDESQDIIGLFG